MVILNTWTQSILEEPGRPIVFAILVILCIVCWIALFITKDGDFAFVATIATLFIGAVLWLNQEPNTYHLADLSNASFIEVYNNYSVVSRHENSDTLFTIMELSND